MTATDAMLLIFAAIIGGIIGWVVPEMMIRVQRWIENRRPSKPSSPDQIEVSFSEAAARLMIATERKFMRELCARQCEMAAREHERHGFRMAADIARECEERIRAMRIDDAAIGE